MSEPRLPASWTWLHGPGQQIAVAATFTGRRDSDLELLARAGLACRTAETSRRKKVRVRG